MGKSLHVLAVDDDKVQLAFIRVICSSLQYPTVQVSTAESAEEAFAVVESQTVDVVITDYRLPGDSGLSLLKKIKQKNPLIAVIMVTAFESTQDAIEVIKSGADDYLVKPLRPVDLKHLVMRISERLTLQREDTLLRAEVEEEFDSDFIIFKSRELTEVLNVAARSAASSATVLIRGESGTGKELIAQLIHRLSGRRERPFVTVNVAALPESLVESELFGHRRGSFTGASENRSGRFAEADGGTLFIDEIGDITPAVQVKLLRALQFGQIQRVGDDQPVSLSVRIIAATNRNLEEMIERNLFRSDLFYRLNVVPLNVPPLRERKADIPALVDHFVRRFNAKNGKVIQNVSHEAMDRIMKYDYPGNVRELENVIERAVILARGPVILEHDLPELLRAPVERLAAGGENHARTGSLLEELPPEGIDRAIREYERTILIEALARTNGNQSAAARILGITERKLRSRMVRLEVVNRQRLSGDPSNEPNRVV